ncbi:bacterial capsule synthesis protein [Leptospira fainei serovar Hurstbridge str. BUT 6]|uniref:Bacterial capsule synthesis protein n=1 Tax=Leptospira fainei serovar Hurstbridge str. BUT 6 TaxID=1193011 RepID=S3VDM2_9LEPT|nr:CapA family protein [Leptospira fainei]EPG74570.1 bacterial capsule synthesis protein [Leptospira fainei serovar Hurstbridge str. BUT 6]
MQRFLTLFYISVLFLILDAPVSLASAETETIKIKAVGDLVMGTNYPDNRLPNDPRNTLFSGVESTLRGSDVLFANFESTLTDYPTSSKNINRPLIFAFRTPPSYAKILKDVGFDILSIANNHSLDFHQQGFDDTAKNISSAGMRFTGKKGAITYMTVKGVTIAWIGFSHMKAAHNNVNEISEGAALVKEAKKKAQLVFISVHGGAEGGPALHVKNEQERFYGEYRGNLVALSHALIDAGADLFIGHGPHLPRALELYRGRLVAYSLGNFLGYRVFSTKGYGGYSLVLEADLDKNGNFVKGKIHPLQLSQNGVPSPDPENKTTELMQSLTKADFPGKGPRIQNDGTILP